MTNQIAAQVIRCSGRSGTNIEYLLELARALRNFNIADQHVFELERMVLPAQQETLS
jgi:cation transport regulator ChaC